jgi:shikimate kinase
MAYLDNLGKIIFLDIEPAQLKHRLMDLEKRGVVCAPGRTIDDLYSERRPLYRKYSKAIVSCTALQPEAVVAKLMSVIDAAASFPPG